MIEESKQSKVNFDNYLHKFVHTIDGDILGNLEFINMDYLIVKKGSDKSCLLLHSTKQI